MVTRARLAASLLAFLLIHPMLRAQAPQPQQVVANLAALQGTVVNADGHPLQGIHIELDDANTALPVTSTYTQQDGTFELYNIPKGNYEVVAESTDSEVSGPVDVQGERPGLELRLPSGNNFVAPLDAVTSVARILVPPKAQRMYQRACYYFNAGKVDQAQKELDSALQIDPEFGDALTLRGLIQLRQPDSSAGQQSLEQAIKVDPSQSSAYIALAALYNHQGRFDDAMLASQRGLSLAPRTWQAYMEMAKASIAKSMYQRGLKFIRQAERLGGNAYAEVHLVKAYALIPLKLYKDAHYELQASLSRQKKGQVADQAKSMLARLESLQELQTDAKR